MPLFRLVAISLIVPLLCPVYAVAQTCPAIETACDCSQMTISVHVHPVQALAQNCSSYEAFCDCSSEATASPGDEEPTNHGPVCFPILGNLIFSFVFFGVAKYAHDKFLATCPDGAASEEAHQLDQWSIMSIGSKAFGLIGLAYVKTTLDQVITCTTAAIYE